MNKKIPPSIIDFEQNIIQKEVFILVNQNNFIQNIKISQIDINTIIIGADIAKEFNVARAFDYSGVALSKKELKFSNYASGYEEFNNWIGKIAETYNKSKVSIGAEPTGHYWLPLYEYILNKPKGDSISFDFVLLNPHHVKKSKGFDDNSQRIASESPKACPH